MTPVKPQLFNPIFRLNSGIVCFCNAWICLGLGTETSWLDKGKHQTASLNLYILILCLDNIVVMLLLGLGTRTLWLGQGKHCRLALGFSQYKHWHLTFLQTVVMVESLTLFSVNTVG